MSAAASHQARSSNQAGRRLVTTGQGERDNLLDTVWDPLRKVAQVQNGIHRTGFDPQDSQDMIHSIQEYYIQRG